MTKEIRLFRGEITLVDDDDFEWLNQFKWHCTPSGYASSMQTETTFMHRVITNAPKGMDVDHINKNPLDNRRSNLRVCTHRENMYNMKLRSDNTTGYKGVHYFKRTKQWTARVWDNGNPINLGYFNSPIDAAKAYDVKARELHGEFASLNFPD